MWDVTAFYKNSEGTEAERLAVYNAIKGVPKAQHLYEFPPKEAEDVFFDLIDIDAIGFGESFDVVVNIENRSNEKRTISAVISATSIYYTGAPGTIIKKAQDTFSVNPGQKEILKISVTSQEYLNKLVDHSLIKIYAIASVAETKQTWSEEDDFTLTKPEVTVRLLQECNKDQDCTVEFRLKSIFCKNQIY